MENSIRMDENWWVRAPPICGKPHNWRCNQGGLRAYLIYMDQLDMLGPWSWKNRFSRIGEIRIAVSESHGPL
jgi:hypothetical protein